MGFEVDDHVVVLVFAFGFAAFFVFLFSRSLSFDAWVARHHLFENINGRRRRRILTADTTITITTNDYTIDYPSLTRSDFPADFKFGASTSALQIEGSANVGGRGDATWDLMITIGKEFPELPASENVATLSYYKYKEDVQLLKNMNLDAYRFSISWSRILPKGKGDINQEGIDYYNNLINELIDNGIEPFATLFHFDLPVALQNEYHGFLDSMIVDDFRNYCDICFKHFGDRVKRWVTFNEPSVFAEHGYSTLLPIPNDATRYPYIVAHNLLLAHAAAVTLYKQKYQTTPDREIGISMLTEWFEPYSNSIEDKEATARAFSFLVGWFVQPLVYGEYPFIIKSLAGDKLPCFSDEEKKMVIGAYDFIGINYYTGRYVKGIPMNPTDHNLPKSQEEDKHIETTVQRYDGTYIGETADTDPDRYVVPYGLREMLIYMKLNYNDPKIYITENGISEQRNDNLPLEKALNDPYRITFIQLHLNAIQQALRVGVNVKGYFIWSLMDCMEIGGKDNYSKRLGLNYTDYNNKLKRIPKLSAKWLSNFMKPHTSMEQNFRCFGRNFGFGKVQNSPKYQIN